MNVSGFNKCSNCGACCNACPKEAISVDAGNMFYSLTVDADKCVDCGICAAVCPVNNETENTVPLYAGACWHKEDNIVQKSSSGGAFHGIAQSVLSDGGVVFGAVYSDDCKTVEFASTDEVPLEKLQKSKYVESLVGLSFSRIKTELERGRRVLFCGTPCQTAGLKSFLKKDYERLIICDFACGGLPSHKIYQNYLRGLEKKYRSAVEKVDFRPKTHGWRRYAVLVSFENGKNYNRLGVEDEYLKSFLYGKYTVRDYCLECKFSDHHMSDITVADFWLHKKLSDLENENGISLILCNTPTGKKVIDAIKDQYVFEDVDVEKASYNNKATQTSEQAREKHTAFLKLCEEEGLAYACGHFLPCSVKDRVKNKIVRTVFRTKKG